MWLYTHTTPTFIHWNIRSYFCIYVYECTTRFIYYICHQIFLYLFDHYVVYLVGMNNKLSFGSKYVVTILGLTNKYVIKKNNY